jgi:hypothetical protein
LVRYMYTIKFYSQIRLFADDSIIYRPIKTQADCIKLQEDLESAVKWEQDWLMAFHPDKCNILHILLLLFGPVRFYRCFQWYRYMGPRQSSSILVWVVQEIGMLYLLQILNRVTLSADLKWNNHIQQMTSKANKSLSFIRCNL